MVVSGAGSCRPVGSGNDASEIALRHNDTVNGVISVIQSSKRTLLDGSEERYKGRLEDGLIIHAHMQRRQNV